MTAFHIVANLVGEASAGENHFEVVQLGIIHRDLHTSIKYCHLLKFESQCVTTMPSFQSEELRNMEISCFIGNCQQRPYFALQIGLAQDLDVESLTEGEKLAMDS